MGDKVSYKITGKGSLSRAIALGKELKRRGFLHKRDWDWTYYPSQEDGYKRIDIWVREEKLMTLLMLLDKEQ